jgi:hypothetical protein
MRDSQFGFEYTWDDLKVIRPLVLTVLVGQLIGAGTGVLVAAYADLFANLWAGAATATFPCFLLGLVIQHQQNPGSLRENRTMVRRLGLIALLLSLAVFVAPLGRV